MGLIIPALHAVTWSVCAMSVCCSPLLMLDHKFSQSSAHSSSPPSLAPPLVPPAHFDVEMQGQLASGAVPNA